MTFCRKRECALRAADARARSRPLLHTFQYAIYFRVADETIVLRAWHWKVVHD